MPCRIGMTMDVDERVLHLKGRKHVPAEAELTVIASELTYEAAMRKEASLRMDCGFHCEGADDAPRSNGQVWVVYRLDW